jgi:hypothetical protein
VDEVSRECRAIFCIMHSFDDFDDMDNSIGLSTCTVA